MQCAICTHVIKAFVIFHEVKEIEKNREAADESFMNTTYTTQFHDITNLYYVNC